jgi:hypothetical protein
MLASVYRVLVAHLGMPPVTFRATAAPKPALGGPSGGALCARDLGSYDPHSFARLLRTSPAAATAQLTAGAAAPPPAAAHTNAGDPAGASICALVDTDAVPAGAARGARALGSTDPVNVRQLLRAPMHAGIVPAVLASLAAGIPVSARVDLSCGVDPDTGLGADPVPG